MDSDRSENFEFENYQIRAKPGFLNFKLNEKIMPKKFEKFLKTSQELLKDEIENVAKSSQKQSTISKLLVPLSHLNHIRKAQIHFLRSTATISTKTPFPSKACINSLRKKKKI